MDQYAVVTGGGTGIGQAVARRLAAGGSDVIIVGRRDATLRRAAADINAAVGSGRVSHVVADLAEPDEVAAAASIIGESGRPLDLLVNNAGGNLVPNPRPDLVGVRDDWLRNLRGNVLPTVLTTAALLPIMARPGGRIVTISSVAAFRGPASYGGAKAALHPWSAELAIRLAPDGIAVNIVAPGYVVDTDFYGDRMSDEFHAGRSNLSPARRGGTPDEIAATVVHLASPEAGFLTGQIIQINGGQILGRG